MGHVMVTHQPVAMLQGQQTAKPVPMAVVQDGGQYASQPMPTVVAIAQPSTL